ncbi:MAG: HAD-IA family hydrolase [Rhodospirillaceae bacterium]|nr:HAD-IA family hydrolase [Rhodospirillaceae bacterium]
MQLQGFVVDLDGVVTQTQRCHALAWKELFDDYMAERSRRDGSPFTAFDATRDFATFVDGRPRYQGVVSFLDSRSLDLPYGAPDDPPGQETVCGLGNRKNALYNDMIRREGVEVFGGAVRLIRALAATGVRIAVVSASRNCRMVIHRAKLTPLFEVVIDGIYADEAGLHGKPAPDTFRRAADLLHIDPARSAMVEDAVSGIKAGLSAGYGLAIGVDRGAGVEAMMAAGAHVVVPDLGAFPLAP